MRKPTKINKKIDSGSGKVPSVTPLTGAPAHCPPLESRTTPAASHSYRIPDDPDCQLKSTKPSRYLVAGAVVFAFTYFLILFAQFYINNIDHMNHDVDLLLTQ